MAPTIEQWREWQNRGGIAANPNFNVNQRPDEPPLPLPNGYDIRRFPLRLVDLEPGSE